MRHSTSHVLALRFPMVLWGDGVQVALVVRATSSEEKSRLEIRIVISSGKWWECPFHYRGLECKGRKSGNTWSNRQIGLGMRNEAGQWLIEFCQENTLIIANTLFQQHRRKLYTRTSPDCQHQNQNDYILCSQRWRSSKKSAKVRPGADVAHFMNSLLPNSDLHWRQ